MNRKAVRPSRWLAWVVFAALLTAGVQAAEKPRLQVNDYQIEAQLLPVKHELTAQARVKFTALEDLSVAVFELNNALRPTRVVDEHGNTLQVERVTQDSTIRVALPSGLAKGSTATLTFDYAGTLESGDQSPVPGLKLAYVSSESTYLLYAGRWFPVSGYGLNRFTSTISVTVPAFMTVVGSGNASMRNGAPPALPRPSAVRGRRTATRTEVRAEEKSQPSGPVKTYTFVWDKPSFPGTILAGTFGEASYSMGGMKAQVFFQPVHKERNSDYGNTALRELREFSSLYGAPLSTTIKVVELPDDTVPSAWAPEIAAIAGRTITAKLNYRLLANAIAHQWWGVSVSPATRDDWWISDGFARYSEARYVQQAAGDAGYEEAVKDIDVGAMAYDNIPLASVGTLDVFSPEFQSLVTDKGAAILHMLRYAIGSENFDKAMHAFATQYQGRPATINDFRNVCEQRSGEQLGWFFTQWLNSTGAPEFKNKYTIYRLGNNKGFRVVGEITQDLDLFRMPVELKVDTDGKSEQKRIEVVGTDSPYTIETFGRPRRILIDPNDRVLKNSPEVKVRTAILRGQQLVQQGDLAEARKQFQNALSSNQNSSLAHYRIAEVFFLQHNYQAAANAYREALNGDGEPRWTEVWSHIQLGKIFDLTDQRERATNEYRQALQTNDNTQGAMDEARRYLQAPYKEKQSSG
jgi:hypothetical protein